MNALIRWSIRYRGFVALLSIVWLIAGTFLAMRAPLDVFPEFVPPQVTIQTETPGLAPDQVEQIITRPIEAAIVGAPGIDTVRSESIYGLSVVLISFKGDVDAIAARQGISERLTTLNGKFPVGFGPPKLTPLTSSTMDVLKLGILSDQVDPYTLRDIADWTIKPRLLAVPGIARVTVYGGAVRQVQVQPDLKRIAAIGLTVTDVMNAVSEALALRGGGVIETSAQRITIETPPPSPIPQTIAQAVVTVQNNRPVLVEDLAKVTIGPAPKIGDATIMGQPGVLITVSGQFGANTLEATNATEAALAELTPALERRGITLYPALHRPASFVVRALKNLETALVIGSGLILIVLYAFLRSVRASLISFLAIPLSLLAAVAILSACGQSLNTMTLGGFALALGVLVDDAIIDIENIARRLRLAGPDADRLKVIEEASIEIRGSMLYGTLAVIFAFFPVLFASGVQGRFIGPMALTFIIAVLASMVVALTVTPALCALFLTNAEDTKESPLLRVLKSTQSKILDAVRRAWWLTVLALAGGVAASVAVVPFLYSELIPQFREGHFVLQMAMASPGTSTDDVVAVGERVTAALLKLPFVETVAHQIGRAEAGEDTWSVDRSEFHIELRPVHSESEEEAQNIIRDTLRAFPEVRTETLTFLGDRISESLSGETAQVVISAIGTDLDALEKAGADIQKAVSDIPGVTDLRMPRTAAVPTLSVKLDPIALANYGLTERDALDTIQTAFAGTTVGQTYDGTRTVDVVVIMAPDDRNRLDALSTLMIANANTKTLLKNVASITLTEGRSNIQHDRAQRRVAVTFNGAKGYSLRNVVAEARQRVAKLELPKDVFVSFTGQAEAEREGQMRLAGLTALSTALIVTVLTIAFRRRRLAILVLINLPFCLIGSIAAIVASGIGMTLGSLVGLITVFGIGARNSVMMLAHVEHLADDEGKGWSAETIRLAAAERLAPVFMTALMAALGLIPLALGLGRPGHEIEAPMAITILGGLATATFLNLGVLPEALIRLSRLLGISNTQNTSTNTPERLIQAPNPSIAKPQT
ncbi:efflux RND transporter permease subunit [Hyphomicrobium sp.]|uniref:efflux RND transporter permease subunit n=1 Tax=Hyphomicrobium sp. TaxID=82 RepID=UPI000F922EEC|nr:efflux RND transporter permease subunit [Hyphomicrobium sp.]RUO99074.1 MAG: efflux RND transporter permease subunit [Hyphomicrobium sp.]